MIDVTEILVHWHAGRSLNEMSQSLGVDRKTIRKYVAPAVAAGVMPGGPVKSEAEWAGLVREWFPELADTRLRQVTWPAIGEHHDYILAQVKAGVRMSTIWQRLRDEHRSGRGSVGELLRQLCGGEHPGGGPPRPGGSVWARGRPRPGSRLQIDYGMLGRWVDPASGKLRTAWAFVMVLACVGAALRSVRPVLKMDQRAWTRVPCRKAFGFFGGVPASAGAGQPQEDRGGQAVDPWSTRKVNRSYAEARRRDITAAWSSPARRAETAGPGPGRAADAACAATSVLARPGVRVAAGADAGRRGRPLVAGSSGAAGMPAALSPPPPRCSRRGRAAGARGLLPAEGLVRAGLAGRFQGEDRPGHPRPGRAR